MKFKRIIEVIKIGVHSKKAQTNCKYSLTRDSKHCISATMIAIETIGIYRQRTVLMKSRIFVTFGTLTLRDNWIMMRVSIPIVHGLPDGRIRNNVGNYRQRTTKLVLRILRSRIELLLDSVTCGYRIWNQFMVVNILLKVKL